MQTEEKFLLDLEKRWEELGPKAHPISYRKDQVLFYEGHQPCGLFVLLKGEIRFTHQGKSCEEKHLWNFQKTKLVCLKSFLEESSYACHAQILSDAEFLFLPKMELLS
ncbi:MAG: cyclic nucleotide-binding domain-containing protein [Deltaproteobacteria bacterium]|nr:cyclic nucleotide-binding domain-containing protein [Deltaproteobacteria bacterium]